MFTIKGKDVIGTAVNAPLCPYDYVYVMPMNTIKMDKGTGVVTSVPSDSPDDLINFKELKEKEFYRKPFNIELDMLDREIIDIIEITSPDQTQRSAEFYNEKFKVKSHKDAEALKKAKEASYKYGFDHGKMIIGEYAGKAVRDAKPLVKKLLIDSNQAHLYWEPENEVIARNGDVCIVSLADQW